MPLSSPIPQTIASKSSTNKANIVWVSAVTEMAKVRPEVIPEMLRGILRTKKKYSYLFFFYQFLNACTTCFNIWKWLLLSGEFDCLAGVAVNKIGQYIIADRYNHRIQIFDATGHFIRSFGSQGTVDGKFSYPWGITTDSLGLIYVCDKENHRVQVRKNLRFYLPQSLFFLMMNTYSTEG